MAHDIDSPSSTMDLRLSASPLPSTIPSSDFDRVASCSDSATTISGTGQTCTWTMNGQLLDPAMVYDVVFSVDDGDAINSTNDCSEDPNVCNYKLNVKVEDAEVLLDAENKLAVKAVSKDGSSGEFHLLFSAWELSEPDDPNDGTAAFGNLETMVPDILLLPIGPGDPELPEECSIIPESPELSAEGYAQTALFDCTFTDVPVNTYQVFAAINGDHYSGMDEGALVVYDPGLGSSRAHARFYWPGTAIDDITDPCHGYSGDKTVLAYDTYYRKKGSNVHGNMKLRRQTIDPFTCEEAGVIVTRSNEIHGVSIGESSDVEGDFGWAAMTGQSIYRVPGEKKERNFRFFLYAEDRNERRCKSGPSDRIWIEVWDSDMQTVVQLNGPDATIDAEDVRCGSVDAPMKRKGKFKK